MASKDEFKQRINEYNTSYEQGSEDWFEYFSDNATVYAIGEVKPIVGRRNYEAAFGSLLQESRRVEVLNRDLQVTDSTAVLMQLLRVTQSGVVTHFRESTIWNREADGWKIIHMNTSLAAEPIPEDLQELSFDVERIKVLGSQLATASAQVGIAQ